MAEETAHKPIWRWALGAGWLAAVLAGLGGLASYRSGPQPTGEPGAVEQVLRSAVAYPASIAAVAALFVWALFFLFVFNRRRAIVKSFAVLAIMFVACFAVAAPLRFFAMMGRIAQRAQEVDAWAADGGERLGILSSRMGRELQELGDVSVAAIRTPADVDDLVLRNQSAERIYENHLRQIEQEFASARARVAAMDLTQEEQETLLREFDQRSVAPIIRLAELNLEAARLRTTMMQRLQATKGRWVLENGRVMFFDSALMDELQAMAADHDRKVAEIQAQGGAMGAASAQNEE